MYAAGDEIMAAKTEESLPLNSRSFAVLIQHYEEEAAAARAVIANSAEDMLGNTTELAVAAQCMEELAEDARRLLYKLQACGDGKGSSLTNSRWTEKDVKTLRLLGFDVSQIFVDPVLENCANARSSNQKNSFAVPTLDAMFAVEQRIHELQSKVERLSAENTELRDVVVSQRPKACQPAVGCDSKMYKMLLDLKQTLQELKNLCHYHRNCRGSDKMTLNSVQGLPAGAGITHKNNASTAVASSFVVFEDAFCDFCDVDACGRVRYCVGSASEPSDPLDTAVVQLLNDLDFPFPVQIRRLGPGGDYFIDQRVEIRLVDEQLLVRPWSSSARTINSSKANDKSSGYEHLAKYFIHLYSPAIDLDKAADANSNDVCVDFGDKRCGGCVCSVDDISTLKRQQQELNSLLKKRCERIDKNRRQLEARLLGLSETCVPPVEPASSDFANFFLSDKIERHDQKSVTSRDTNTSFTSESKMAHILRLMEANGRAFGSSKSRM